jgi:hypothetical protein|tara:strand:+ start:1196 stop:1390 length:195 start_codon:yes stop_codon:yes gene_type:complete
VDLLEQLHTNFEILPKAHCDLTGGKSCFFSHWAVETDEPHLERKFGIIFIEKSLISYLKKRTKF